MNPKDEGQQHPQRKPTKDSPNKETAQRDQNDKERDKKKDKKEPQPAGAGNEKAGQDR